MMKLEIDRGTEVDQRLLDPWFRDEWSRLVDACPWATAFQGPAFSAAWYVAYRELFEPVLVTSRAPGGALEGLLALALERTEQRVVVVGGGQAEYQVWVCRPEASGRFPGEAVRAVRAAFPGATVRFRYLPPGTPTAWLAGPAAGHYALTPRRRPLLRFVRGDEVETSLRKGSNKSRVRRLRKLGPVNLVQVEDAEGFDRMIETVATLYDTRQLSLNGSAPFRDDPRKVRFYRGMLDAPGLLHATVLKAGDRIVAAHLGVRSGRELQLGLIAHDPFLAKASPGKLHIFYLCQTLYGQGCSQLDLTAGGEPYKERFANANDTVHTLDLFPTARARRRSVVVGRIVDAAKSSLRRLGVRPSTARRFAGELQSRRPAELARLFWRSARGRLGIARGVQLHVAPALALEETPTWEPRVDRLADLLLEPPAGGPWASSQAFAAEALDRIENGQRVYTVVEEGRLRLVAWVRERPTVETAARELPGLRLPTDHALAFEPISAFDAPESALVTKTLRAIRRDVSLVPGIVGVVLPVPDGRAAIRRAAEAAGFVPWDGSNEAATERPGLGFRSG